MSESSREEEPNPEQMKELIAKRGIQKRKLTIFKNFVTPLSQLTNLSAETIIDLKERLLHLPETFEKYEQIQDRIELQTNNIEEQMAEREKFEKSYYECLATSRRIVDQYEPKQEETKTPPQCNAVKQEQDFDAVKYPDIVLPTFDGNKMEEWLEFRDTFDALINQTKLKPIQKYKYLRSSLKGGALEVISSLEYSDKSYNIAWQLICERYNNPRILVHNHLKALFDVPQVPSTPSALRGFVDNISKHLRTLQSLNIRCEEWDVLVIYFLSSKLEKSLQKKWEERITLKDLPTLQDFKAFLRTRADLLETMQPREAAEQNDKTMVATSNFTPTQSKVMSNHNPNQCPYCSGNHFINQCQKFLALNTVSRNRVVRKLKLCINCLHWNHGVATCRASNCKVCRGKHNTLLHLPNYTNVHSNMQQNPTNTQFHMQRQTNTQSNFQRHTNIQSNNQAHTQSQPTTMHTPQMTETQSTPATTSRTTNNQVFNTTLTVKNELEQQQSQDKYIILSTAQVQVLDKDSNPIKLRALLDSGSQSNFITENAFQKLQIQKKGVEMEVNGFNNSSSKINSMCNLKLQSTNTTYQANMTCFIVPNICKLTTTIPKNLLKIPGKFKLADEQFNEAGDIDLILGAEQFYNLLCIGQHRLGDGMPILQKTLLGWVISGPINIPSNPQKTRCNLTLNKQLQKFWEIEEGCEEPGLSNDEKQCEEIFNTHSHSSDGNFVVSLPLKSPANLLGESKHIAYKRFMMLESRFSRDQNFKEKYINFMRDFEQCGHMIKMDESYDGPKNFLPHHAVTSKSPTTPVRVVFDASCPTDTGISLNDIQHKGTIKQDELIDILLRFRQHKYVINGDIEKMYRYIYLKPEQRYLQCIYWREEPWQKLQVYVLTTLSFGLKSAPYLATRCLLQLSLENKNKFPEAAVAIAKDFYMDDYLSGGDDEDLVVKTAMQVDEILRKANFKLRKWKSNSQKIIKKITSNSVHNNSPPTEFGDYTQKILGLAWSCYDDNLMYTIRNEPIKKKWTKRGILSIISSIFDPLGLLGPVMVSAKIFMQKLWKEESDWDDTLPNSIVNEWEQYYQSISELNSLKIPRHVVINNPKEIELIGFADSSQKAYGAAIYIRSVDYQDNIKVNLLFAKSRVAPIKSQTIPRLELCAAELLAKNINRVKKAINLPIKNTNLFSDSNIILNWIKTPIYKLQSFVANRVSRILENVDINDWHWIASAENPADLLSRGVRASDLAASSLWWQGPSWLSKSKEELPKQEHINLEIVPETKKTISNITTQKQENNFNKDLFQKWSSDTKLKRVFAYVNRFIHNLKCYTSQNQTDLLAGPLSSQELNSSLNKLIQMAQMEAFPDEYNLLKNKKKLPQSSSLLSLTPFYENGLLRVGGRLGLSQYPYHKKYPIILPSEHTITKLIMSNEHKRLLHAGPQLLLASIREKFWPIKGKLLAKKIFHQCVTCFRANPHTTTPIMGNLPANRLNPSPPFYNTGLDYAGPFNVRDRRGRGYKIYKTYIAIFICLATKAIHLELISSLESAAFLSTLRRFIARRGKPKELISDNATTFHGADNELVKMYNFLNSNSKTIFNNCANQGIKWKFIPAYTPHMGGIWEAAVRSCKFHLKRVLGQALLTYEEFSTVLTQIEGILNSRPLYPVSDSDDIPVLTPAHFLVGRPIVAAPDYNYEDVSSNQLQHYQQLQQLQQHFWKGWSRDYISHLQQRTKWRAAKGPSLTPGTIVLVKDDRLPPCQWLLGKIVDTCPGRDGITRVAIIRTTKGEIKRAFNNICPLPKNED